MPRVLASGKTKLTVCLEKPVNPESPTAAELIAGLDLSCGVLSGDFAFGPTDSEKVNEPALCDEANTNAFGAANYQAAFTLWREFLAAGGFDNTADVEQAMEALKTRGITFWAYARRTDKKSTEPWAAGDEIYFGAELSNDNPQSTEGTGFIKYRVPCEVQKGYPFIEVAAA